MAKGKQSLSKIDTPVKRSKLAPSEGQDGVSRGPYFERIRRGLSLGYFKPRSGPGNWWVRVAERERAIKKVFAVADDEGGEDVYKSRGLPLYTHAEAIQQAQAAAKIASAARRRGATTSPVNSALEEATAYRYLNATPSSYTVGDLLADHALGLKNAGKVASGQAVAKAAAGPLFSMIASRRVAQIRGSDLLAWRDSIAASAPLRRHSGSAQLQAMPKEADAQARRRRRVRVNRLITDLRAARNRVTSRVDWLPAETALEFAKLEKFDDVGRGKVRPLDADEVSRLLASCGTPAFRDLVLGALLTGARYGEMIRLRVGDFRREDGKLHFDQTKDEQEAGRDVALSLEGIEHFLRLTNGREPHELVFPGWRAGAQCRPMREAVEAAALSNFPFRPTFHSLRDTFATALLRSGVRLEIVSKILGHSSVALTEKHYAKFADSDIDTAARSLPRFTQPPADVVSIVGLKKGAK